MIEDIGSLKTSRYLALYSKALDKCSEFFTDEELIELLLHAISGKNNVRSIAKELLSKYGDLNNLININDKNFNIKNAFDQKIYDAILIIREILKRTLTRKIGNQNILNSYDELKDYLKFTMMSLKIEHLRILFLNRRNILITDEILSIGTVDELPVFPREIVKRALHHEASSIILVHNHPGGSTKPSQKDIKITDRIINACNSVNIKVLDHIIISNEDYFSFSDIITEWEKDKEYSG